MPAFIPGLDLSRALFEEAIEPILLEAFPGLVYGAALIGPGSEVLGFDTEMSMDHSWGPRLQLFLSEDDAAAHGEAIIDLLRHRLPQTIRDFPIDFGSADPADGGTPTLAEADYGPVNHRVEVHSLAAYIRRYLAFELDGPLLPEDWLTFPQQKLRSLTSGAVFRDGGGLSELREFLAYYPHDIWLYQLAAGWSHIGEDEHLLGRAGFVGDELGARIIAARITRSVMQLCFLCERTYAPYAKWFGTAFGQLTCAPTLSPLLGGLLSAVTWQARDAALSAVLEHLARMHNALGITPELSAQATPFFGRPFHVIRGERFAEAIRARITDPAVQSIAERRLIGGIDQVTGSTDLLEDPSRRYALLNLYR